MYNTPKIYCQFDPLEELWLGGCYPIEYFNVYPDPVQSAYKKIAEITLEDLEKIENILKSLDLLVHRPYFTKVDDFIDKNGFLLKPPMTPRDYSMTLGNNFYHLRNAYPCDPWQHVWQEYINHGTTVYNHSEHQEFGHLLPPCVTKVGKDIYIDKTSHDFDWNFLSQNALKTLSKEFRINVSFDDGHSDSVFCLPREGLVLTSHWKHDYSKEFPGWEVHVVPNILDTTMLNLHNLSKNWWIQGLEISYQAFNEHLDKYALDWIGCASETVFTVNSLVINENLILTTGYPDNSTVQWLKKHKIDFIPIQHRAKTFWDGGIHCLTADIRRRGEQRDFFPNRIRGLHNEFLAT
jgi:hypothetical protein